MNTDSNNSEVRQSPAMADDAAMRLFSQYRLFLLAAIAAVYYLSGTQTILGQRDAVLFEVSHLGYLVASLGFIYLHRLNRHSLETQFYLQNYMDIVFICLLMYASGGVQTGFGNLLLVTIALLSQVNTMRYALFFAALASVLVLFQELIARLLISATAANFESTAVLGSMLFLVAWLLTSPVRKLTSRQIPEATRERAPLNVKQIATLNEEIIRELDSGVLVIDSANKVQLMNDTARTLLGCEFTPLPVHVGLLSNSLFDNLQEAKRGGSGASNPFVLEAHGDAVLPRYIPISAGGMLLKLDDHAHIRKQFQQLKLASLGRLSASIAHEIRNPLGAISHAVQLLQESGDLTRQDAELLDIAHKHTRRINRIVEDVLQLSNRKLVRTDPIDLGTQVQTFCERFREEHGLGTDHIELHCEPNIQAIFDPEHLDQVLWNLCTNARLHNDRSDICISLGCWQASNGYAIIDIADNGAGIADIHREQLFEPFYSTHHDGSGLGLYIIRELCELNKASIECLPADTGAHFRITMGSALQMAA